MTADRVVFVADAAADIEELAEYLDARNPSAAVRVRDAILASLSALAEHAPRLEGRPVTLRSGLVCRRWFVHPAVIYYARTPGLLTVLRVYHHAREPIAR